MGHAQRERLRLKTPTCWLKAKKADFCFCFFALMLHLETFLFHESVCSVYGPRTARTLACKSTFMTWPKANEQILSLELYAAHTIKNFTFSLKRLFKIQTTQSHNACV